MNIRKKYFFIVLCCIMCIVLSGCDYSKKIETSEKTTSSDVSVASDSVTSDKSDYDASLLEEQINKIISSARGDWSVYVEAMNTNECCVEINNKEVRAASVIKLFNMATFYEEVENGNIEINEKNKKHLENMITVSSNTSSNEVVSCIGNGDFLKGAAIVTEFAEDCGCVFTQEQHRLYDVSGPASGKNTTSVEDCGLILKKIYKGKCVSEKYDKEMIELLKRQQRIHKIPSGVPENTVVANKTGENSRVELDVGIVFSPKCDYVICISATQFNSTVYNTFTEISKAVYDFFNETSSTTEKTETTKTEV